MAFKTVLGTPQASIVASLATGIVVYAIWNQNVPNTGVIHATNANDSNIEASRKKAVIESAAVLSVITLLTKDVNVFILGGVVLFALDFSARHANASNPVTQNLVSDEGYADGLRSVS